MKAPRIAVMPLLIGCFAIVPLVLGQPALPGKLTGYYLGNPDGTGRRAILPVELVNISMEGESVKGQLHYRSPAGNCITDETSFSGTFKDATFSVTSARLKSQFADGRPCGRIKIEVKLEGRRGAGTLTAGGASYSVDLEAR